jgi:cellulose synthase (UDP-forming)
MAASRSEEADLFNRFTLAAGKDSHKPIFLRAISVLAIVYLTYYIGWRVTATLNPDALVFSWVLVLAEAFGVLSYIVFAWMTQDTSPTRLYHRPRPGLTVDILIPTYDESLDILEATLVGCNQISYPHHTYILDDGQRSAVKDLTLRMGCQYLVRETSEHAKAGNINAALPRTSGEFVVILDADTVPQRGFLNRTLGYFDDPRLAVIQMPQEFYNRDSMQHDRQSAGWHEQSLFFRVIQPGKNHSSSAFWCGSPSIIRRRALDDIGGVATSTITEDIHTSVRWHSRGWRSYFLNETLAFGIAPQTLRAFLVQRLRWASGTMQLYGSAESPLRIPGLTLRQRISYVASFMAYFEAFQKLVLLAAPVVIIVFNVLPMRVNMVDFVVRWVPYFLISILASVAGGRGHFRYFQTEKYSILKMLIFIQSTATLLTRKPLKFVVTPKSAGSAVYRAERQSLVGYFIIQVTLTAAVIYGLIRTFSWDAGRPGLEAMAVIVSWALYNAFIVLGGISDVLGRSHERLQSRFPVDIHGELVRHPGSIPFARVHVRDLSITGVGFTAAAPDLLPRIADFSLTLHSYRGKRIVLPLAWPRTRVTHADGSSDFGVPFAHVDTLSRRRLFEFIFVDMPERWQDPTTRPGVGGEPAGVRQPSLRSPVPAPEPIPVRVS